MVVMILLPIAAVAGQLQALHWRRDKKYFLGLTLSALTIWGPLYYAIVHAGVGASLAVNYASLVIGMFFFGWLMAGERMSLDKWLAAGLGLAGVGLVFSTALSGLTIVALGAAVVSGSSSAFNMVIAKKLSYKSGQVTILAWATAALANTPMIFILQEPLPHISWRIEWLYLLLFALASIAATWTFIRGIQLIEVGAAGVIGLLEIVFGVVFGVVFFHERPTAIAILGVGLIILAAAIPYIKDYNPKKGQLVSP